MAIVFAYKIALMIFALKNKVQMKETMETITIDPLIGNRWQKQQMQEREPAVTALLLKTASTPGICKQ